MQLDVSSHTSIIPINKARTAMIEDARVLIVEDNIIQQTILATMLQKAGFRNTTFASSGSEALELVHTTPFDLILLDLSLPDIDGLVVCQCIHELALPCIPAIILQTGSTDSWHKIQAFESGASDYIVKPVDGSDLVMRSIIHLERRQLQLQLERERERILQELSAAADTQHQLLPNYQHVQHIAQCAKVDIASHVQFSSELGGDLWGAELISPNLFGIYTVDFSGHGLKAALNTFRLHAQMQKLPPSLPNSTLSALNSQLHDILPTGHYATMFYAVINMLKYTITYSTAGAPLPIIMRGDELIDVEGSGIPLGCKLGCIYDKYTLQLKPGDKILIYSDALVEHIPNFSVSMIPEIMRDCNGSAQEIIEAILNRTLKNLGVSELKDDLTLIAIKI